MASHLDETLLQKLMESFNSLLDEPLILAIVNDHDLRNASDYEAVCMVLQTLAQSVITEENYAVIPTQANERNDNGNVEASYTSNMITECPNDTGFRISESNLLLASTKHAESNPEIKSIPLHLDSKENGSEEMIMLKLKSLFPDLKEFDVNYALKKANGDFETTLNDLLNMQYLQSTGQQVKGINGFFGVGYSAAKKTHTKKGKRGQVHEFCPSRTLGASTRTVYESMDEHGVAFMAEFFDMPVDEVSAIYHKQQCLSDATVVEILNQQATKTGHSELGDSSKAMKYTLQRNYRRIPERLLQVIALIGSTRVHSVNEIAILANNYFSKQPRALKLELSHRLTPLPDEDLETPTRLVKSKKGKITLAEIEESLNCNTAPRFLIGNTGQPETTNITGSFAKGKWEAANLAAKYHAKGASNPLYRQAASYYAKRASEQVQFSIQARLAAANILVQSQSSSDIIDLHGVSVEDGVIIARERVLSWWKRHDRRQSTNIQENDFTIITGLGRHSAGGVSQLRKAVFAALSEDGWKLKIETGRLVIIGR